MKKEIERKNSIGSEGVERTNDFVRYIKKCDMSLKDDTVITYDNVQCLGKFIALLAIKRVMHFHGERGYRLYTDLIRDILYKKGTNENYSDGYDLACEAICFLCEHIGKSLGEVYFIDKFGKIVDIRYGCFKAVFSYIHKNLKYERTTIDINDPCFKEVSVPFESESVKPDTVNVNKIMRQMGLNDKEKHTIKLIMGGMNPYQVSKHLKLSNPAIYSRVKQVRKKYIKTFGVPYESYVY